MPDSRKLAEEDKTNGAPRGWRDAPSPNAYVVAPAGVSG